MAFPLDILVELQLGDSYATVGGPINAGTISTPSSDALNSQGSFDVSLSVAAFSWAPAFERILASKWDRTNNQGSWQFSLTSFGTLKVVWTPDGTTVNVLGLTSTIPLGFVDGSRHTVQVVLQANDGSGNRKATFYADGTLLDTVTAVGVSSVASLSGGVELGTSNRGGITFLNTTAWVGRIYTFRYSTGQPQLASYLDLTHLPDGLGQTTDQQQNIWTIGPSAHIHADWVTVSPDSLARTHIDISRGRPNEYTKTETSSCSLELRNPSGNYSPRNPSSIYYSKIGRNTPIRVSLPGTPSLYVREDFIYTDDSPGLSIVGDLDLRIDIDLDSWQGLPTTLISKALPGNASYSFYLDASGQLGLMWSPDGGTQPFALSTVKVPFPQFGRKAVRAALDVDNGAGGHTVTFYTSDTISGAWVQLGLPVTQSGVTSIYAGSQQVWIAGYVVGNGLVSTGSAGAQVYAAQIYDGTTLRANLDFTAWPAGTTTFTDGAGGVWYITGNAELMDRDFRFYGVVSEWQQLWDHTGRDVSAKIVANGILRRLGLPGPIQSTMYRGITNAPSLIAYWPMEDGSASETFTSGLSGGYSAKFLTTIRPTFAADSRFTCAQPLPTCNGVSWTGRVSGYVDSGLGVQTRCLIGIPDAGLVGDHTIFNLSTSGSITAWIVVVRAVGTIQFTALDRLGNLIFDSGAMLFGIHAGQLFRLNLGLKQVGANINWYLNVLTVGAYAQVGTSGTIANQTVGKVAVITVNPMTTLTDTVIGHVSIQNTIDQIDSLADELNSFRGELAAMRLRRLTIEEESLNLQLTGSYSDTVSMGPQLPGILLDLIQECVAADGGILFESRDILGLMYRTRSSMYTQLPKIILDYSLAHLSSIQPVDDDLSTTNDIAVTRANGSTVHLTLTDGPLSVPIIGEYSSAVTLNVVSADDLPDQASWRLHLGTVNEARFPILGVELARKPFVDNPILSQAIEQVEVGNMITVVNPPRWLPPEDIRQLVQGFKETLTRFLHTFEINCSPASPFDIAVYGSSRYCVDHCIVAADHGSTIDVVTSLGPVWGTTDLPYDVMVAGERMTVTAVSGSGKAQTLTVTRSVNGIIKTQVYNEPVQLFPPTYYGL